jgi:hypothetical protein
MTSATVLFGFAGPAAAQQQAGLVNINIGDVEVIEIEDVNVAVAANIVAAVCVQPNLDLAAAVLAVQAVDQSDEGLTFTCEARGGAPDFTITQDT